MWETEPTLSAEVLARGDRVGLSCSEMNTREKTELSPLAGTKVGELGASSEVTLCP